MTKNSTNSIKRQLFNPSIDKYYLFGAIKANAKSLSDFEKKIKVTFSHPITKHLIDAKSLPRTTSEIGTARLINYSSNLFGEIGWVLQSIEMHKEKIIEFNNLKLEYEKSLLLCEFEFCNELLDKIEDETSISIWSIENRFILMEYWKGSEANWDLLSSLSESVNNTLLLFMIECLSKKTEIGISYYRYSDYLHSKTENLSFIELTNYLQFQLNYDPKVIYSFIHFFLTVESIYPVIDRYLILKKALIECIKNLKNYNEQLDLIKEVLERLESISNTSDVINALTILDGKIRSITDTEIIILLCDLYTTGKYKEAIQKSIEILRYRPNVIEVYEVYVKSLIFDKQSFVKTEVSDLVDEILLHLYNLIERGDGFQESALHLKKLAITFSSSGLGKQLLGLVSKLYSIDSKELEYDFSYLINSDFNNPRIISLITNSLPKRNLIQGFSTAYPDSISLDINIKIVEGKASEFSSVEIEEERKILYENRARYNEGDFSSVINSFINNEVDSNSNIYKEERIRLLYNSFLNVGKIKEALKLFVEAYFDNINLISRLKVNRLLESIIEMDYKDLNGLIELPVFVNIASPDTYTQYVALDLYLADKTVETPSQLDYNENDSKQIFFLDNVCRAEVMQYSIYFDDQEEIERERQNILRLLLKINSENEEKYIKEITELTQNKEIRRAIQEVNKGRITVNVPQLKSIESSNLKESYERFAKLSEFTEKNENAKGLDVSSHTLSKVINRLLEERKTDSESVTNNPAFISFKSMYLDMRDKFLLSKEYGLDGYLSTRIRHGTLENHVRSIFEKYNLLAEKNNSGEYQNITYWEEKLVNLDPATTENIQHKLKTFSKRIDEKIRFIINELIQVYTEKQTQKPKALFNYAFSPKYLWVMYRIFKDQVNDKERFIDYIFDQLEEFTKDALINIRSKFKSEIKEDLIQAIDELQNDINLIANRNLLVDINTSILNSRTDLTNEIERISEWFYLSNPTSSMISDVMTTVKTAIEITNSIYPNHQIEPKFVKEVNMPIKGAIHVIYISRILLDNIIKHSGIEDIQIQVDIYSEIVSNQLLRLGFEHQLDTSVDKEVLKGKLQTIKDTWKDRTNFERTNIEGGSGFNKIRRILAFDLKGKNYGFNFSINQDRLYIGVDVDIDIRAYEVDEL